MEYAQVHWPSKVRREWQVSGEMYAEIARKVLADWTAGATRERKLFRIAGQSGSGKSSQLLPAVEAWFSERDYKPVLVATRRFVKYHPFAREIEAEYGRGNLREMTNGVSIVLLFLVLRKLIAGGYDVVLDVPLLDPQVEGFLMGELTSARYEVRMSLAAVSKEISDGFVAKRRDGGEKERGRVVAQATAAEFWRAMELALGFYAKEYPGVRMVVWSAWDEGPVFDGKMGDGRMMEVVRECWGIKQMPREVDEGELAQRKVGYMRKWK